MKTQTINSRRIPGFLFIIMGLLLLLSCGQQSGETGNTEKKEVTVPTMDLHTAVVLNDLDIIRQHIEAGSDLVATDLVTVDRGVLRRHIFCPTNTN